MTKEQLDNLITFYIIFRYDLLPSPCYIEEKWDKYIGIDECINIKENPLQKLEYDSIKVVNHFKEWIDIWGEPPSKKITYILLLIAINSKEITPSGLVKNLGIFFDVNLVNNKKINGGLHVLLNDYRKEWIIKNNRDYKLTLLIPT